MSIAKSSSSQFWIVSGLIANLPDIKVFPVAIYHETQKPANLNEYISDLIDELNNLHQSGVTFKSRTISFSIYGFFCDAPALASIKQTKEHSGFSACTKCDVDGDYIKHRMAFLETNANLRSDHSFRSKLDEDHHIGSALEALNIDMVEDFPVDPMHTIYQGVVKKRFLLCKGGPLSVRLSNCKWNSLSDHLVSRKDAIPKEFARKPRTLKEIPWFKATEFRQFLLYTGPVVLKGCVFKRILANF